MRSVAALLLLLLLLLLALAPGAVRAQQANATRPIKFAVRLRADAADAGATLRRARRAVVTLADDVGAAHLGAFAVLDDVVVLAVPAGDDALREQVEAALRAHPLVAEVERIRVPRFVKRVLPIDPIFARQWFLVNQQNAAADLNVLPAWNGGVTGLGRTVAVVDDGVQYTHPDFSGHFSIASSYDFQFNRADPSPVPGENHGTRCAGLAAAAANDYCGVGVAFQANVAGLKMLFEGAEEDIVASALTYRYDLNDVYTSSWGPNDDGKTVEGPTRATQQAIEQGATSGRNGLGSVYIVASGNGKANGDDCNFDGYANSVFTYTIGSVNYDFSSSSFSEGCSALFAVTFSAELTSQYPILTSDLDPAGCMNTGNFAGTSASAPMAAGIVAMVLQARPELTRRDIAYVLIQSAIPVNTEDGTWQQNGAGLLYSHRYGFGLLDASEAVDVAKTWTSVGTVARKHANGESLRAPVDIPRGQTVTVPLDVANVTSLPTTIERVLVTVALTHPKRGSLQISLTSPAGTVSVLAPFRRKDTSSDGYAFWTFTTFASFGETAWGQWVLTLQDSTTGTAPYSASLTSCQLTFVGTGEPAASSNGSPAIVAGAVIGSVVIVGAITTGAFVLTKRLRIGKTSRFNELQERNTAAEPNEPDAGAFSPPEGQDGPERT